MGTQIQRGGRRAGAQACCCGRACACVGVCVCAACAHAGEGGLHSGQCLESSWGLRPSTCTQGSPSPAPLAPRLSPAPHHHPGEVSDPAFSSIRTLLHSCESSSKQTWGRERREPGRGEVRWTQSCSPSSLGTLVPAYMSPQQERSGISVWLVQLCHGLAM